MPRRNRNGRCLPDADELAAAITIPVTAMTDVPRFWLRFPRI